MPKAQTITLTILPTSDLTFGGHVDFKSSVPLLDVSVGTVLCQVQAAAGGLAAYVMTDGAGYGSVTLGPTPTWSSGGGAGKLEVLKWDAQKASYSAIRGSEVSFTVTA